LGAKQFGIVIFYQSYFNHGLTHVGMFVSCCFNHGLTRVGMFVSCCFQLLIINFVVQTKGQSTSQPSANGATTNTLTKVFQRSSCSVEMLVSLTSY